MSDAANVKQQPDPGSNTVKDPKDWVTGDEPATGAQRSYLQTLGEEAHEQVPTDLTKAQASEAIDELRERTGRGQQDGVNRG
jgi:Protein of unknown function (DUF3072)